MIADCVSEMKTKCKRSTERKKRKRKKRKERRIVRTSDVFAVQLQLQLTSRIASGGQFVIAMF